ncbi:MAG: hypothetical protein KIS81_00035 [Maricaulaceae bacterium]|nr:hypothetical protein [Maricaulaceae bacterium]
MNGAARKFTFDTEFSSEGEILRDGERVRRILTEEEAEALRQEAFHEGRQTEAAAGADALRAIASQMQLIITRLHGDAEILRAEAAHLAVAAARKIAAEALAQWPEETILALAREAMADLRGEPRFSVHCDPALAETLATRLGEAAKAAGFDGAVRVRGQDGMRGADCRLEWGSGAVERSADEIGERLEALARRWLAQEDAPAATAEQDELRETGA